MTETDTSFAGLVNYVQLFHDAGCGSRCCTRCSSPSSPCPSSCSSASRWPSCSSTACRGGRSWFRCWCCRRLSRRSSPAPHGGSCSIIVTGRSTRSSAGSPATRCRLVDGQSRPRLSRHHLLRDLAVDALHVPDPAGGALQCRPLAYSRPRRSTARGFWRSFLYIVLPAIWPVMAIAILIRGLDLFRIFDIIWALTGGRPRHHDRNYLGLYLRPGLPAVRVELHGGDRLPGDRASHRHRHLGHPAHGAGTMTRRISVAASETTSSSAIVAAMSLVRRLSFPDLLAVHRFPSRRQTRSSPFRRCGIRRASSSPIMRCCSRMAMPKPSGNSLVLASVSAPSSP